MTAWDWVLVIGFGLPLAVLLWIVVGAVVWLVVNDFRNWMENRRDR